MPQLIVRRLEPAIVQRLRERAAAEGVSVEEAHRRVLREALLGGAAPPQKDFLAYLESMPDVGWEPPPRQLDQPRDLNWE